MAREYTNSDAQGVQESVPTGCEPDESCNCPKEQEAPAGVLQEQEATPQAAPKIRAALVVYEDDQNRLGIQTQGTVTVSTALGLARYLEIFLQELVKKQGQSGPEPTGGVS